MPELKPCEYCQSEPTIHSSTNYYFISCTNPVCGAVQRSVYKDKQEAIEAWNKRKEE